MDVGRALKAIVFANYELQRCGFRLRELRNPFILGSGQVSRFGQWTADLGVMVENFAMRTDNAVNFFGNMSQFFSVKFVHCVAPKG